MHEALLHYIWKNSLYTPEELISDTGEKVRIIEPGNYNNDGGPDFTDARIAIENTIWAGTIEIHIQASDWFTHNHHLDPTYDNVILHVVACNNKACYNSKNRRIPCVTVAPAITVENTYNELIQSKDSIPCRNSTLAIDTSRKSLWIGALTIERLQLKHSYFLELLRMTKNNWENAYSIHLFRSFGQKINALPFELLAKSIPLKSLCSQPGNLFRTEAILFGQAGFLDGDPVDDYHAQLRQEFHFHRKKYNLNPLDNTLWRFLRLRPLNFPTIRIAQLSDLISKNSKLFTQTLACQTSDELLQIYSCTVSDYWKTHYTFGNPSKHRVKELGIHSIHVLIINAVVPVLFAYGEMKNRSELKERAIHFLEQLPPEKNHITRRFLDLDFPCRNAAESQALLELASQYCSEKRCLDCQIGNLLLTNSS